MGLVLNGKMTLRSPHSMWMWAWGATGSAEISVEVGALPARLEGGVTAGGQVGGALESSVGMGGALEGTVLMWVELWGERAGVDRALEGKCWCGCGFGAKL